MAEVQEIEVDVDEDEDALSQSGVLFAKQVSSCLHCS